MPLLTKANHAGKQQGVDGRGLHWRWSSRNDPPGAILSLKQRLDTRDDGQSRIACTLRTTRPGRANNNASKTSPLEASSSQASQKTIPFQQGKSIIIQNTWGNGKIRHSTMSNQSFRFLKRSLLNISGNWRGKKSSELNFLDAFDALLEVWKFALLEADVLAGLALTRRDCCSVCS